MNRNISFLLILTSLSWSSCNSPKDPVKARQAVETEFKDGNFLKSRQIADSLKQLFPEDSLLLNRLDSLAQISHRIELDFSLAETEITERLQRVMGEFSPGEKLTWEKQKLLEYRMINGEKRYFKRAATNLKLLLTHQQNKGIPFTALEPGETALFRIKDAREAVERSDNSFAPVNPATIRIKYTVTVDPDAVPAGEVIRCWMPWPKESHARQKRCP